MNATPRKTVIILVLILSVTLVLGCVGGGKSKTNLNKTVEEMQENVSQETEQQVEEIQKTVSIEAVDCDAGKIYIRNTGSLDLSPGDVKITASGKTQENSELIVAGNTQEIDFGESLTGTVKVEAPGNTDSETC